MTKIQDIANKKNDNVNNDIVNELSSNVALNISSTLDKENKVIFDKENKSILDKENKDTLISSVFHLYHENNKVLTFTAYIYDCVFRVEEIISIHNQNLIPLTINKTLNLQEWINNRCFPNSYQGFNNISHLLANVPDCANRLYDFQTGIALLSYFANLTDKYWITPDKPFKFISLFAENCYLDGIIIEPKTYDEISFFINPPTSDNLIPTLLATRACFAPSFTPFTLDDYRIPEICTDGEKKKRWIYKNNEFYLQKEVNGDDMRFMSDIAITNFEYMPTFSFKTIDFVDGFSSNIIESKCLTDQNTSLISAYDIILSNAELTDDLWTLFKKNYLSLGYDVSAFDTLTNIINNLPRHLIPEKESFSEAFARIAAEFKNATLEYSATKPFTVEIKKQSETLNDADSADNKDDAGDKDNVGNKDSTGNENDANAVNDVNTTNITSEEQITSKEQLPPITNDIKDYRNFGFLVNHKTNTIIKPVIWANIF